ncbi:uncharacterized protein LOC125576998 [Brassica napus]|uniref:uncharacterized protein LOC125576998 n=1 Tax=Brassica napus TaxID=3708 RepID=UPI002078FF32|nr:uncharacterized protein LOC125576998 [Brassica napus]
MNGDSRVLAIGEGRVLESGDRDATMMDVGERARPPGDPPDAVISWAAKAAGTNGGGMPNPESIMDDSFVAERLRVDFPNGEDGEPSITIESEVLEAMNGMWKQCMIIRVLGRSVAITALNKKLRELWRPKGVMHVMDLPRQFFMVRFEKEEDYLAALTGGPWRAFGSYLMVRAWSPEFDPLRDDIVTTPVWIRLSNIPVNFYHRSILMGIAKGLGRPIRVDLTTLNFERARFARICVEVNLAKPLKGTVLINGERYFVAYEGLSVICSKCGIYGHLVHGCPKMIAERMANLAVNAEPQAKNGLENRQEQQMQEDGFVRVKGPRRGSQMRTRQTKNVMGETSGEASQNQEIAHGGKTAEIALSNKYGSLEMDTNLGETREDFVVGEENKENQDMNVDRNRGKEISRGKETMIFGGKANIMTGLKVGNKDKWAGDKKTGEGPRGRPKKLNNRPARGLVFGPTKGEISLSESGKRLRVERLDAGRDVDLFRENAAAIGVAEKPLQLRDEELANPMDNITSEMEQGDSEIQTSSQGDGRVLSLA